MRSIHLRRRPLLTSKNVWEALIRIDPSLSQESTTEKKKLWQELHRGYVEDLARIFQPMAAETLTLSSLARAILIHATYMLEEGRIEKHVWAAASGDPASRDGMNAPRIIQKTRIDFERTVRIAQSTADNPESILKGTPEEPFLVQEGRLPLDSIIDYRLGKLKIEDILLSQPKMILRTI